MFFTIAIFFIIGILLGILGLRLLHAWEDQPLIPRGSDTPHGHQS